MLPAPDLIYKCPKCGKLLRNRSLMSGNTFGAMLYSDGKQVAPMLPQFPDLTKCSKCDAIFWLSDLKSIGEMAWNEEKNNPKWKDAEYVEFLDIPDLLRALKQYENDECAGGIRRYIWLKFNDRIRDGKNKELFDNEDEKRIWKENCKELIKILSGEDDNVRITKAELYRSLGEFDQCMNVLSQVSEKFNWLKSQYEKECERKNSLVFKLILPQ
jgi:uncharacterized C2H2 Zn-finger protein